MVVPVPEHNSRALHQQLIVLSDSNFYFMQGYADTGRLIVFQGIDADYRTGIMPPKLMAQAVNMGSGSPTR